MLLHGRKSLRWRRSVFQSLDAQAKRLQAPAPLSFLSPETASVTTTLVQAFRYLARGLHPCFLGQGRRHVHLASISNISDVPQPHLGSLPNAIHSRKGSKQCRPCIDLVLGIVRRTTLSKPSIRHRATSLGALLHSPRDLLAELIPETLHLGIPGTSSSGGRQPRFGSCNEDAPHMEG